ncbi:hypothetical protein TTHERM_000655569 (macronuclear) [Tetrahymena thermophila SB210]|uniref:Uncharacterized protein n=1 Tax=Tetrahymena thermophila (strain SB210) TaxID=312017 RepID=W7WZN5_TETTS|nr:hypothetical protein TTHERM_000655569 [Tetrahymena thermophila SB210]EWS72310.1 hypothetical protein TTHERM_000655569 [Tetrahymena thermophila SB210]|eukprot:XP_012655144.1 hypothetical protein TTHERM_000655569 [Tetrahymena thermophila SB210]
MPSGDICLLASTLTYILTDLLIQQINQSITDSFNILNSRNNQIKQKITQIIGKVFNSAMFISLSNYLSIKKEQTFEDSKFNNQVIFWKKNQQHQIKQIYDQKSFISLNFCNFIMQYRSQIIIYTYLQINSYHSTCLKLIQGIQLQVYSIFNQVIKLFTNHQPNKSDRQTVSLSISFCTIYSESFD